jgi:hypothetical protein
MDRRNFVKTIAGGTAAIATSRALTAAGVGGLALMLQGCGKNISGWITAIVSGFAEVKSLLPDLGLGQGAIDKISTLIAKGAKIAQDFDDAYKAGKFSSAIILFKNLGGVLEEVRADLGINADNKIVKAAFAVIGFARVAVAIILDRQGQNRPEAIAAAASASGEELAALAEIKRLAATELPVIR